MQASRRYVPLLYPLWGLIAEHPADQDRDRFCEWTTRGSEFICSVAFDEADVAVLPCEWPDGGHYEQAHGLVAEARLRHKPLVVFYNSDSTEPVELDDAIVFRTSLYGTTRRPREFGLPGWSCDFRKTYSNGHDLLRPKRPIPSVGYVGYIESAVDRFIRGPARLLRGASFGHTGAALRRRAVSALSSTTGLQSRFLIRSKGMTGRATARARREYADNILDTDYSLVVRGGGNFSYRLYEVLSCGRIPLFVNTDCVLPYDDIVDWRRYMVWVEADDIGHIGEKLLDFHASLSPDAFVDMQQQARSLYENWLSPVGFHRNLWRYLA